METTNDLTGIILAGGRSTRFGSDKASALLDGRPMMAHVVESLASVCANVVVAAASGQRLPNLDQPVEVVRDTYEARGPLAGIVTGLTATETELAFIVSADAPLIQPGLVRFLADRARSSGADIVCPRRDGWPEPLVSVYRRNACLEQFRTAVERNELKVTAAYGGLNVEHVDEAELLVHDPSLVSFINVNTMSELDELRNQLRSPEIQ